MLPLFLWYLPNLVDPACVARPWAVWDGKMLHWCAGEGDPAKAASLFEAETITSLPAFIAHGVRFNQTGMAQGNLYEGPMFALDKNKRAVRVGDAVKVAGHHTVVREIRVEKGRYSEKTGALPKKLVLEVLSDNGDPECADFKRNGATFISWDAASRVTRLDNAPHPGMRAADRQDLATALGVAGLPAWDALLAQVQELVVLRAYLRVNADTAATAVDVCAARDQLAPEDQAIAPSWGGVRRLRHDMIHPFLERFLDLARARDARAHEEAALLLSVLSEDDPTRGTIALVIADMPAPAPAPAPAGLAWGRLRGATIAHLWRAVGDERLMRVCAQWRNARADVTTLTPKSRRCTACLAHEHEP